MKTNWQIKPISKCLQNISKLGSLLRSDYLKNAKFPVIDQGQDFIAGYTNNESLVFKDCLPVVIFGDHTRTLKFIDFPFAVGADGTKILKPSNEFDPRFFYYMLQSLDLGSRGYARHFKLLKEQEIPLPPLATQQKIVARLDELLGNIAEAKRLRQEAITDTEKILYQTLREIFEEGKEKGWEEKTIEEIAVVSPAKSEIKDCSDDTLVSFIPMASVNEYSQSIENQEERKLGDVRKGYTYFKRGDIILAKVTPCMENGKIALANNLNTEIGFGSSEFHVIRANKDSVLPEYLYQILRQKDFRDIAETKMTGTSGLKRVPKEFIETYSIPLPPLPEQHQIVTRLDALSAKLCELRQLQAEQLEDLKKLEKAYLREAFRGELI